MSSQQELLVQTMFERLRTRLHHVTSQQPLDLDYLQFVCSQEAVLFSAVSDQVLIPKSILDALTELHQLVVEARENQVPVVILQVLPGATGRPRFDISPDSLSHFLNQGLPVPCIANLIGVSTRSIFRRMSQFGLSVRALYTTCSDAELDNLVTDIKNDMPHAGYRLVKGSLQARGFRVQWERVRASMHRVDTVGILCRMNQLGCVVRRTYSVPGPRALVHLDTNHKLIRIERLWRDVWCAVTSTFYSVLHSLEEDGLFDLSNIVHLYSCHYAFLPRLQASLDVFSNGWDNHPLRTEGNLTPNQIWEMGNIQHAAAEPENAEGLYLPYLDWEDSGLPGEQNHGVTVPEMENVLSAEEMASLTAAINPLGQSQSHGADIYLATVQYVQHLLGLH